MTSNTLMGTSMTERFTCILYWYNLIFYIYLYIFIHYYSYFFGSQDWAMKEFLKLNSDDSTKPQMRIKYWKISLIFLGLAEPSGGRDGYAVGKDGSMYR